MLQQKTSESNELFNKSNVIKIVISKADGQNTLLRSEECEFKKIKFVKY